MACAVTIGISACAHASAGDQKALQGSWQVVDARARLGSDTATALEDIAGHGTIIFVGNKVTLRDVGNGRDSSSTFAFTLDAAASPRRIDMIGEGPSQGNRWIGIYRIAGDSLQLALPIEHWTDRPVPPIDFGASNTMALILRRERH
jgi:uncharacterized protein (TIGR03067 family)